MKKEERYASVGLTIVERDGDTLKASIATPSGPVTIMADLGMIEDRLILDKVDVDGDGLTLPLIHRVAQAFGVAEDVKEVIVQSGRRSSGAPPRQPPNSDQDLGEIMTTVLVSGWNPGFSKVGFTRLLQRELSYSLSAAKRRTDALMENQPVDLQVEDSRADALLALIAELGARCAAVVTAP